MVLIDINESAGLALIAANENLNGIRYVPAADAIDATPLELYGAYLKQCHYVARVHVQGLVVARVDPMLPGWKHWDAYAEMFERPRQFSRSRPAV